MSAIKRHVDKLRPKVSAISQAHGCGAQAAQYARFRHSGRNRAPAAGCPQNLPHLRRRDGRFFDDSEAGPLGAAEGGQ